MKPDDIVAFWLEAGPGHWFTRDAGFHGTLTIRFGDSLAAARRGEFDAWGARPESALGLVILLDQMSRNVHRGTPLAFAADAKALGLAKTSIAQGFHQRLPAPLAMWFLMPLEHAEDIDCQHRCVALFETLGLHEFVAYAKLHRDIIASFERFPHRNPILGRTSTPAELAFMKCGGFSG